MNYNHLRYFYAVAKEGSIVKASEALHISPQTISGQLSVFEDSMNALLFERRGKRLILNETGKLVFEYAEDIFSLGNELEQSLKTRAIHQKVTLSVGMTDVIPKTLAVQLLEPGIKHDSGIKLICREGDFNTLLSELALNKLDLILSDRPLTPGTSVRAQSHLLGECGLSFYVCHDQAASLKKDFPQSLHQYPFLRSGDKSNQMINLQAWFDQKQISPVTVAEFDDSALMKQFGQSGYGVFCTPSIIEQRVIEQFNVSVVGRTTEVMERFYAISPERKVKHSGVKQLLDKALTIFSN